MAKFVLGVWENSEGNLSGNNNFNIALSAALLPEVSGNSSGLRFFGSSEASFLYQGKGITFGAGAGDLLDVTGGTITGLVGKIRGEVVATVTGWNISAAAFYDFVEAPSENAAMSLFFNGSDEVIGSRLGDTIMGFGGNDTLIGAKGNDQIQGGNGRDRIDLGNGNDLGFGEAGNDTVLGSGGNDTLYGSAGNDILTGGIGADSFRFELPAATTAGNRITDFQTGVDKILLQDSEFGGLALGVLSKAAFRAGTDALDASDRIIYDAATGALFFDADGNGNAFGAVQFAAVQAGTTLLHSDFAIVSS